MKLPFYAFAISAKKYQNKLILKLDTCCKFETILHMYEFQTKFVLDAKDKSCKITVFLIEGVTFFFNLAQMFISVHFSCEPYLSSHLAKSPNYHWTLLWFSGRSAKSDGFSKMPIEKPKMGDYPRNLLDFWRSSLVVHNVCAFYSQLTPQPKMPCCNYRAVSYCPLVF